nr:cytochrome P460 family protein [Paraburkholderia sp. BL8N3]
MPADYRTDYRMPGVWAVVADDGPGSKRMHVVYASPGTIAAKRNHGHFPDGSVLVKEVFKTLTYPMTTGTGMASRMRHWPSRNPAPCNSGSEVTSTLAKRCSTFAFESYP